MALRERSRFLFHLMNGSTAPQQVQRVQQVGQFARVLVPEPLGHEAAQNRGLARQPVEDGPTLLVGADVEADEHKGNGLHELAPLVKVLRPLSRLRARWCYPRSRVFRNS